MEKFKESDFQKIETNIDDIGVGFYHGNLIRIIPEEKRNDFKMLLEFSNTVESLIGTEILFEEKNRLILKHPIIKNITFPPEWTTLQKIKAAQITLNIQKELIKRGYYLIDPHGYNVTFDKHKPIFIDFGSITKGDIWPIYWFLRLFLNYGKKDYWGEILQISKIKTFLITTKMILSKNPYLIIEDTLDSFRLREIKKRDYPKKDYLGKILKIPKIRSFLKKVRKIFEKSNVYSKIENNLLRKLEGGETKWSFYGQKDYSRILEIKAKRVINFIKLLKRDSPQKLLDIGANVGAFSKLALNYGVKEVIAIDIDERSLNILLKDIKNNSLPIWVANVDLMNHPEKLGDFKDIASAEDRLSSDFCICFALIHHLCYFGSYSFEDFAKAVTKFVNKTLIVEFVPYTDIYLAGPIYKGKDKSWYTKENFINTMKKYFKGNIEIFESDPQPRKLIRFQKT